MPTLTADNTADNVTAVSVGYRDIQAKGQYALPENTVQIYGPYLLPVYMGAFLTPIHAYVRVSKSAPVYTGRKYGPYIRAVFAGSAYRAFGPTADTVDRRF